MAAPSYRALETNEEDLLWDLVLKAGKIGVRLEMVGGTPIWEAMPSLKHQGAARRILDSIKPDPTGDKCACYTYYDAYIRFADGSLKCPDISIFCREVEEVEVASDAVPDAVVEVISRGYEAKDIEFGVPFYLANGVGDVLLVDPRAKTAELHTQGGVQHFTTPATVRFHCGCTCSI